uniref:RING-type domain-containing protein n=1 Tax=Chromera velia CCMP2878 TaxID=1169474 RepID=A0A0G4I491_9ALVE|eukprot:Cvel_1785.t1-p1 / transcript=Cvel_1785.t1 / gene=Cvel_1785 / organism=Chromera_velia_CCMP2878 / gene_product=Probable E3 ubiquitin-protein ligase LUL2, putative / transcript_product=Probable E3 ubiquitin-protein ligase LUL2, putative / location=Cvel_scaffold65:124088-125671(-) / protein_length=528 / sequence_SO=supercontig / SO=protein_coding / is_pseudo=false
MLEFADASPGVNNLLIVFVFGTLFYWTVRVAHSFAVNFRLFQKLLTGVEDPVFLEGVGLYVSDFLAISRTHFNQLMRMKRTVPPSLVPRVQVPVNVKRDTVRATYDRGVSRRRADARVGVQFEYECMVDGSVSFFWGVPVDQVQMAFGRKTGDLFLDSGGVGGVHGRSVGGLSRPRFLDHIRKVLCLRRGAEAETLGQGVGSLEAEATFVQDLSALEKSAEYTLGKGSGVFTLPPEDCPDLDTIIYLAARHSLFDVTRGAESEGGASPSPDGGGATPRPPGVRRRASSIVAALGSGQSWKQGRTIEELLEKEHDVARVPLVIVIRAMTSRDSHSSSELRARAYEGVVMVSVVKFVDAKRLFTPFGSSCPPSAPPPAELPGHFEVVKQVVFPAVNEAVVSRLRERQQRAEGGASSSSSQEGVAASRHREQSTAALSKYILHRPGPQEAQEIFGLEDANERECTVCMSNTKDVMLLPCKHASLCRHCLRALRQEKCPLCRANYSSFVLFPMIDPGSPPLSAQIGGAFPAQ